jgi:hypothetical protein
MVCEIKALKDRLKLCDEKFQLKCVTSDRFAAEALWLRTELTRLNKEGYSERRFIIRLIGYAITAILESVVFTLSIVHGFLFSIVLVCIIPFVVAHVVELWQ